MLTEDSDGITLLVSNEPGLGTCFQAMPFQCTISVFSTAKAFPGARPAAQTSDADRASTADREPADSPGIVILAQLVPFQCSTVGLSPTAQASEDDSTLTPLRPNLKSVTAADRARKPGAGAAAPSAMIMAAAKAPLVKIRAILPAVLLDADPRICILPIIGVTVIERLGARTRPP